MVTIIEIRLHLMVYFCDLTDGTLDGHKPLRHVVKYVVVKHFN